MMHEPLLAEFERHRPALERCCREVEQALKEALAANGVTVHFVAGRVKSAASLKKKLARPDKTYRQLWDVTDLVGLRVATYFEDTIDDVARLIERTWKVDFSHSVDKRRFDDSSRFGYRSLHYVCAGPVPGLEPEFRFEIQVRTALQHAWAEVEHDLGYKADASAVPEVLRRRFARVASLLEVADEEFVSIRRELGQYQQAVRSALAHAGAPLPLDAVSLAEVVRHSAVERLDRAVAEHLHKPLTEEVFFPEYLVRMLRLSGIGTTAELMEALAQHGQQAPQLVAPYFAFAQKTWHLDARSLEAVHRGYGLFFVAHLAVLRGPDLGLSRVMRLTRLYQELDYPADERTAHQVASGLLAALGA